MSKGKSQAGVGKSHNNGVPNPSGSSTFHQALNYLDNEEKVKDAMNELEDKQAVQVSRNGRKFTP